MIKFITEGETPAKKNSRVYVARLNKSFPSERYRKWHSAAVMQLNIQKSKINQIFPIEKCSIVMVFTHGDKRRRDSDNGVSSIFDTLVDCKILEDDNWDVVESHYVFNRYEKSKSYCEIYICNKDDNIPELLSELKLK